MNGPNVILWLAVSVAGLIFVALLTVFVIFFRPWLKTFLHGRPVTLITLIGMRLRGAPMGLITDAYVELAHSGSRATIADIERAYHANPSKIRSSSDLAAIVRAQEKQSPQ
ncbi:MAG: hypothetical protein ABL888_08295 [Pirellulaceae bacterium]